MWVLARDMWVLAHDMWVLAHDVWVLARDVWWWGGTCYSELSPMVLLRLRYVDMGLVRPW